MSMVVTSYVLKHPLSVISMCKLKLKKNIEKNPQKVMVM